MSIKPLDMQVMLPKSVQIDKIKMAEHHKFANEQMYLGQKNLNADKKNIQKINKKNEAEEVDLKDEDHNPNSQEQKEKNEKREKQQIEMPRRPRGFYLGHFDASV